MKPDTEGDLLFGLLALQSGLIDQDQFVAALQVWSQDRARPIVDVLSDRGDLDPAQRALVDGLVAQHQKRQGGSVTRSLAAIDTDRVRRDLGPIADSLIGSLIRQINLGPSESATDASETADDPDRTRSLPGDSAVSLGSVTARGERFRVLRPHAQGGLGAVFVALDTELHREVALKQILESHADDLVSRARFLLEAEITGALEHPGIVPVYGLGTYDDGRPYYAMRFIKGDSLKEAIDQFHGTEPQAKDSGPRSLELRRLLRCFTDVCNAIEYAHSRGVLHRDIKPRNVIVGRHGETLVVDWGLAKATGQSDPTSGERSLVPSSASSSAETLPGSALGTPAFMSPEQAEGQLERLGPWSDVYSLGATLYYLLTGVAPFAGDVIDVIRDVQRGAFPPPRQVNPSIDLALEAVCLKAMALAPGDRYATSRALVNDIDRWAADEPVSAWKEPVGVRARRWARRNRTAVATAAVAVLALLFGTTAVLAVQTRANNRLSLANSELAAAKDRETARFNLAMEAIKHFHGQVDDDLVLKEDRFKPLRDKLLRSAAGFYGQLEGLLKNQPDRPSRRALGDAYHELGNLTYTVGDRVEGIAVFRKALAVRRALASEPGANAELTTDVARTLRSIGILLQDTGNSGEAIATFEESRQLLESMARAATISDTGRLHLAFVQSALADLLYDTGKTAEAMVTMDRAIAGLSQLVDDRPEVAEYRFELAADEVSRGFIQTRDGKMAEALESQRRARAIFQKLTEEQPAAINYRIELGRSDLNIGYTLEALKRPTEALTSYGLALATYQKLANDNPAVTSVRVAVTDIQYQMGRALSKIAKPAQALESLERARSGFQKLAEDNPAMPMLRFMMASCDGVIGEVMRSTGRPAEATVSYRQAITIIQKLVDDSPEVLMYLDELAANHLWLGELLTETGNQSEAEAECRTALAGYQKLFDASPTNPVYRTYLARCQQASGAVLRIAGRQAEAMEPYRRARQLFESLARENPSDAEYQSKLGETLNDTALCEMSLGRWTEARDLLTSAIEHQRKARSLAPEMPADRQRLRDYVRNLLKANGSLAQPIEPVRTARDLAERARENPEDLYDVARALSLTVPLTSGESRLALAAQAVAMLEQAVAAGWRDAVRTDRDPDFAPLRDRDDFRRLVARLFDRGFPEFPIAPRK